MKLKLLVNISFGCVLTIGTLAQYVPNGGFENWENRTLFEEPVSWNTGNLEAFMSGTSTARDTSDSYSGELALRIETVLSEEDTLFGYAFCQGTVTDGSVSDTLKFEGGIPISGAPDSLFGYFKYHVPAGDTAIVLASFKYAGTIICQNIFSLTGDQNSYVKMGWEIDNMVETPDTAMIAFACTNPDDPLPGGWIQIDSLWFGGIVDTIPNADFERWETTSYQEPVNWVTANIFSALFGGDTCATPSTDAHSGSYSLRIESVETLVPSEDGFSNAVVGFGMPYSGSFFFGESMPTFSVDFNPSELTGYYKFDPMVDDTAMIMVILTDSEDNSYYGGTLLTETDTFTHFSASFDLVPTNVDIIEVGMVVSTSTYFMQGDGQSGDVGSILLLDDLELVNPCDGNTFAIYNVISPTCDNDTALIDAGPGWDEYLWSNGATSQSIAVVITDAATYSVTVTDNATGCEYSDEVDITLPICDAIDHNDGYQTSVDIFPNPSSGLISLAFHNSVSGEFVAEIIAITGKTLKKETLSISQTGNVVRLDLSDCPSGLYLIKISGNNFNHCERIMIN